MRKQSLDFIVIGAQKAGTTSLFEYLRMHPAVYLPPGKERPFFSNDPVYEGGWSEYLSQTFHGPSDRCLWGTVTPQYMAGAVYMRASAAQADDLRPEQTVPRRIRKQLPEVKLIALLRDPVARCISHYTMNMLSGLERRPIDDALTNLLSAKELDAARVKPREENACIVWGEYGRILTGYFEEFAREQMLILFSDDLRNAPQETMRRTFEFLGVDSGFVPPNLGRRYREGSSRPRYAWLDLGRLRRRLASIPVARRLWWSLPRGTRSTIERWFISARYQVRLWNRQPAAVPPAPSPELLNALTHHYSEDTRLLFELIGEPVPWDKR
jgi:hypothetical protein